MRSLTRLFTATHRVAPARLVTAGLCAVVGGLCLGTAPAAQAAARPAGRAATGPDAAPTAVVDLSVSFSVRNLNRSGVPCASDGAAYTVRGHLVLPAGSAGGPSSGSAGEAVTVYPHTLDTGEWTWRFDAVAGYDHARLMAERGHASLTLDLLGYGASDHPRGTDVCVGSEADVVHQVVQDLRAGRYAASGGPSGERGTRFGRIVLAGQSIGGQIAEIEAYSFHDIDDLVLLGYADDAVRVDPLNYGPFLGQVASCVLGGAPADAGTGPGYAPRVQLADSYAHKLYAGATDQVIHAAVQLLERNPCGVVISSAVALIVNPAKVGAIDVPVLLVYGQDDPTIAAAAYTPAEAARFSGSPHARALYPPGAGHYVQLTETAQAFREALAGWLDQHAAS
jgi:pimeloyl-ACP methyl ester carboxylesterase